MTESEKVIYRYLVCFTWTRRDANTLVNRRFSYKVIERESLALTQEDLDGIAISLADLTLGGVAMIELCIVSLTLLYPVPPVVDVEAIRREAWDAGYSEGYQDRRNEE